MFNPDAATGTDASGQNYVFIRYAEVLLNFAEALNEAEGPTPEVNSALNKLRERSNVPALATGLSQGEMREEIRRERRVELSFENKRYLDNKRWKIAEEVMGKPRHNMVIRNTRPSDN